MAPDLLLTALLGLAQTPAPAPVEGEWTLRRLVDARGAVTVTAPLTLIVAGDRVTGHDGCNGFAGRATFTDTTVRFSTLAGTLRACAPAVNDLAERYRAVLARTRGVALGVDSLVLSSGTARLVFARPEAAGADSLRGEWRLAGGLGEQPPTVRFAENGRVNGSTGCNTFTGTFTRQGSALRLSPLGTTRRACTDPALDRQEQAFLRLLADVREATVTSGRLTVRLADGSERTFVRVD